MLIWPIRTKISATSETSIYLVLDCGELQSWSISQSVIFSLSHLELQPIRFVCSYNQPIRDQFLPCCEKIVFGSREPLNIMNSSSPWHTPSPDLKYDQSENNIKLCKPIREEYLPWNKTWNQQPGRGTWEQAAKAWRQSHHTNWHVLDDCRCTEEKRESERRDILYQPIREKRYFVSTNQRGEILCINQSETIFTW